VLFAFERLAARTVACFRVPVAHCADFKAERVAQVILIIFAVFYAASYLHTRSSQKNHHLSFVIFPDGHDFYRIKSYTL
jgi:hypothetical protein